MASSGVKIKKYWIIEIPEYDFDYYKLLNFLKHGRWHATYDQYKIIVRKRGKKIVKCQGVCRVHFLSERTAVKAWGFYNL